MNDEERRIFDDKINKIPKKFNEYKLNEKDHNL
jgi:hypothetical protein